MDICGYHLRCLNHEKSCSDCGHQHEDKNKDYLHDVLNVWPKGKEAACGGGPDILQKINIKMQSHGVSDLSPCRVERSQ